VCAKHAATRGGLGACPQENFEFLALLRWFLSQACIIFISNLFFSPKTLRSILGYLHSSSKIHQNFPYIRCRAGAPPEI